MKLITKEQLGNVITYFKNKLSQKADIGILDSKEPRLIKVSSTDVAPIIHIEDNREYSLTGVLTSLTINKAPLFDDDSFAVIKFNTPATLPENFITIDASLTGFPTVEGGNHYIITFMGNYVNVKSYTIGG